MIYLTRFPVECTTALVFYRFVEPTTQGFRCDDISIRYPRQKDAVPNWALAVGVCLLPIMVVRTTHLLWMWPPPLFTWDIPLSSPLDVTPPPLFTWDTSLSSPLDVTPPLSLLGIFPYHLPWLWPPPPLSLQAPSRSRTWDTREWSHYRLHLLSPPENHLCV